MSVETRDSLIRKVRERNIKDLEKVTCKQIRDSGINIKHDELNNLKMELKNINIYDSRNRDDVMVLMRELMRYFENFEPSAAIDYKYFIHKFAAALAGVESHTRPTQNMHANNRKDARLNTFIKFVYKENRDAETGKIVSVVHKPGLYKPPISKPVRFSLSSLLHGTAN